MEALTFVSKALRKYLTFSGDNKLKRGEAPPLPRGDFDKTRAPKADRFTAGFARAEIMHGDITKKKYYIAGYNINNPAKGILDKTYVHALWLDDNSGRGGMVFVSLDAVGLLNSDANAIKASLSGFMKQSGCRAIHIFCTHNHAGIDTMGLWGPLPLSGKDPGFMKTVFAATKDAVNRAYEDRRDGDLFHGSVEVPDMQKDIRTPVVFSKTLTRLRFVPSDGSREIYWINFASHSESLGGENSFISADFPGYMRDEIRAKTGAETFYCVGAIGGMITMEIIDKYKIESTKKIGKNLAGYALSVDGETKLSPVINSVRQEFYADSDNSVLMIAAKAGILKAKKYAISWARFGFALKTEMTYLEIDTLKMLLLPCEIFPELVYGGYLSAEESATGLGPEVNPVPLTQIAGDDKLMIIGLANDELGYVLPPNDFLLDEDVPYFNRAKDRHGRNHYEETNSMGPGTAAKIAEVFGDIMETVKKSR